MRKILCMLIFLLSVSTSFASVIRYRVKSGDTLPAIAGYYYGEENKALYIIMVNHLDPGKSLKPGKILLIPLVTIHRVRKNETFRNLAQRYLKDPGKAHALAILNGSEEKRVLKKGTMIKIPFELFYRVERGDTLGAIAARYLGDEKDAVFLRDYNRLRNLSDIKPGMRLVIPLMVERVRHPMKTKSPAMEIKKIDTSLYRKDLNEAIAQYDEGEYKMSIDKLMGITLKMRENLILKKDLIKIHKYRAFDFIALDETVAAKGEFMEILKLDPRFRMDPRTTSPKILSVFDDVRH